MHNVRVDDAQRTAEKARADPAAAQLKVDLSGDWRVDETKPQFGGTVTYAKGETDDVRLRRCGIPRSNR